jgi:hypothetical protein
MKGNGKQAAKTFSKRIWILIIILYIFTAWPLMFPLEIVELIIYSIIIFLPSVISIISLSKSRAKDSYSITSTSISYQGSSHAFSIPLKDIKYFQIRSALSTWFSESKKLEIQPKTQKSYLTKGKQTFFFASTTSARYSILIKKKETNPIRKILKKKRVVEKNGKKIFLQLRDDLKGLPQYCLWLQIATIIILIIALLGYHMLGVRFTFIWFLIFVYLWLIFSALCGFVKKKLIYLHPIVYIFNREATVIEGKLAVWYAILYTIIIIFPLVIYLIGYLFSWI